jgi:hypothetical protein
MKTNAMRSSLIVSLFAVVVAGCGGGGDDAAGGPVEFSLNPSEITFTFPGPGCGPVTQPTTVLINGGAGNFVVNATNPSLVFTPVVRINGVYQFTFTVGPNNCIENASIQVNDLTGDTATIEVIVEEEEDA